MKFTIENNLKGLVLSILLGVLSLFLSKFTPSSVNSIIIALMLGIAIGNLLQLPTTFDPGISFTSGRLLEASILFLAFAINYKNIAALGSSLFVGVLIAIFLVIALVVLLANKFNYKGSSGYLIGFGTAICGSSAIAALAPSITKDKEDVAVSMAVVNFYGTLGMIFLPFLLIYLKMDVKDMGLMLGGTLHSVGNVAGAGFTVGPEAGEAALTIKLARVALLTPGLIFINFLINRKTANSWKDHFKLPWYLIGFIIITILGTITSFPKTFLENMELVGKVVLTIAMAAIGLKVSFAKLLSSGRKGLIFGAVLFSLQLLLFFGLTKL